MKCVVNVSVVFLIKCTFWFVILFCKKNVFYMSCNVASTWNYLNAYF